MKRKYFVRGLGLGIFVTALLFSIAMAFYRPTISEERIRSEAAKLGMVEGSSANSSESDTDTGAADEKAKKP
ncbi:MAG: hypothetical protein IJV04_02965 [Lachnospiraceae bacterium]|nr:hypothetical protein [Lachnospiraceae bacterium]